MHDAQQWHAREGSTQAIHGVVFPAKCDAFTVWVELDQNAVDVIGTLAARLCHAITQTKQLHGIVGRRKDG